MMRLVLASSVLACAVAAVCDAEDEGMCKQSQDAEAKGSAGLALLARKAKVSKVLLESDESDSLSALIARENEAAAQEYYRSMALPQVAEPELESGNLPDGLADFLAESDERSRGMELLSSYVEDRANRSSSADRAWSRSFSSGYADAAGKFIGGSEIIHLVAYEGKMYAANGYWMDSREGQSAAQVLRLDAPTATWQQDLDTMMDAELANAPGAHFSYCLRVTTLKALHVTTDSAGNKVDKKILLAACSAYLDMAGTTAVSIFIKTSSSGPWKNSFVIGSRTAARKTPRDAEVYTDKVTGVSRVFLLSGDFGVLSGAYDAAGDGILWDAQPEPSTQGTFPVRALGLAQTKSSLFFSVGKEFWRRTDGASASWSKVSEVAEAGQVNTEVGGIRGLSSIDDLLDLLFIYSPDGSSEGKIFKLNPSMELGAETSLRELYNGYAPAGGGSSVYSLGGYNDFYPITDPKTGRTVHIVGFQQVVNGADPGLLWNGFYAGATYAVRKGASDFYVAEVNGAYDPSKSPLVGARTFVMSPFAGEEGVLYVGGFDANFKRVSNTAWIFKAGLNTVLGNPAAPVTTTTTTPAPTCTLCAGTPGVLTPTTVAGTAYGFSYTCQDAENFVQRHSSINGCNIPVSSWQTTCCSGCNVCPGANSQLSPSTIAGHSGANPYTCQDVWNHMQSPGAAYPCSLAVTYFGPKCCVTR